MAKTRFSTQTLVILSVLTALQIVLARFCSFNAWNVRIGLGFIPICLAGIFFGPVSAALVAAVADILGALLFPTGAYFPGFTLTAALMGAMYGIFLYRKLTLPRILLCVGINQLLLSFLLNTLWISILYGSSFAGLLPTRILQVLVVAPVQLLIISVLSTVTEKANLRSVLLRGSH